MATPFKKREKGRQCYSDLFSMHLPVNMWDSVNHVNSCGDGVFPLAKNTHLSLPCIMGIRWKLFTYLVFDIVSRNSFSGPGLIN